MAEINFSLVIFTLLIGLSTGTFVFYGLWQFSGVPSDEAVTKTSRWVMPILLICMGMAMLASAAHLGQPFRFLNAFRNPGSMIAQEGIWSIALGVIFLISVVMVYKNKTISKALYGIGSLVSVVLLLVCSLVYVKALGYPAWSSGITIIYYFGSALLMGAAVLYALTIRLGDQQTAKPISAVALAAVITQMIITIAFSLHLQYDVQYVTLPETFGWDIARWIIGLIAPAIIAYLSWNGKAGSKDVSWIFFGCVVAGEILSRVIFFMQGVHL